MLTLPHRTLGSTGIDVSCLGLGTVKIGRNEGVKYPEKFTIPDDSAVRNLLRQAQELGINFIDTAPAYGSSEERLGKLMQRRQEWVICTKTGEEFSGGISGFDFSAQHTRHSIERSLKRLRTDYLDLVLVHSDGNDQHVIEHTDCLDTLMRCREQGLIRAVGFSGKTVDGGLLAANLCDLVMVSYNPQHTAEVDVIDHAHKLHKGVLIKKAFDSGHAIVGQNNTEDAVTQNMRFVFSRPGVSAIIAGTINPKHLQQNVAAATRALSTTSA
ncbi:MAG: aldo/keto reductase [Pseudohongiella sp.]|uniref:aldo/keto reductase n=1 Tax=Pseudohongiella sp. TaxID=1979412 RepID=UPI0034A0605F